MSRTSRFSSPLPRLLAAGALLVASSSLALAQPPNPTNPVKLMKGVVNDSKTGRPIDGGKVYVYQGSGTKPFSQSRINPSTGAFQVVLGPSSDYRLVIRSPKFIPAEKTVRTPDGNNYQEVVMPAMTVDPIPVGTALFDGRAFDPNSAELKPSGELTKALEFLKASTSAMVTIAVIPDGPSSKPSAKAKPAAKPKKRKKGSAATPVADPAPAPAPSGSVEEQLRTLAQSRAAAVKALFLKEGIALTRIKWQVPSTSAELAAVAGRRQNLVITITGIDTFEEEAE